MAVTHQQADTTLRDPNTTIASDGDLVSRAASSTAAVAADIVEAGTQESCHVQGHSYDVDKSKLLARLRRIEGQVRGVARMIEEDKYCIDVLTQISAIMSSSRAVGMLVLQDHIRGCVVDSPLEEREDRIQELNLAIERFTRM